MFSFTATTCYFFVAAEFQSRSLEELCSSVKEPEEADHAAKCHLLHDSKMAEEAASNTSDDWLDVLGHDRLRKRVRDAMCLCITKKFSLG